ncbi:alpha/beta hydrolase [Sphaerisporangium corydalis]|uniref:Alpha/beta hydrolase n=1 Tax=Sphaerisporangium corydalis TaxID=1441875 RepID=A0ABV9EMV8_9ACTN|nr:alpha/beta hydrolase [Sphaerisporangium corydalis]
MYRMRSVAAGLAAAALLLSLPCAVVAAHAGPGRGTGPGCGAEADCGTLRVPLDRENPSAGSTTIAYALVRRRDLSRPAEGTIVPNPGGPGVAVIGHRDYAGQYRHLLDRYDLLLVDPRGVGASDPLRCDSARRSDLSGSRALALEAVRACGDELGARRRYYTTAAAADDIDAVRAHLGIGRLDLLGQSYGTYLMTVYAERHPSHVRSIVLSSAYPLDFDMLGGPAARAMRRSVGLLCRRSGGGCEGDEVLGDLRTMARRVADRPIRHAGGVLDETALASTVYKLASSHADLFGRLPGALRLAVGGDARPLAQLAERVRPLSGSAAGTFSLPMYVAVTCNDYPALWDRAASVRERFRQYASRVARLDPAEYRPFRPQAWIGGIVDLGDFCVRWPDRAAPVRYGVGRLPDVPVLVLSGELDLSTPTEEGLLAAGQYRGAEVIEVPSTGHVAEKDGRASSCVISLETQFLRHWHVADRSCLSRIPPVPVWSPSEVKR